MATSPRPSLPLGLFVPANRQAIDVPEGCVYWFVEGMPVITGECDHDCNHVWPQVIAWGPDFNHYELVQCFACGCCAWFSQAEEPRYLRTSAPWQIRSALSVRL